MSFLFIYFNLRDKAYHSPKLPEFLGGDLQKKQKKQRYVTSEESQFENQSLKAQERHHRTGVLHI